MFKHWLIELRTYLVWSCAALAVAAGTATACRAQAVGVPSLSTPPPAAPAAAAPSAADLQARLEAQQREIEELKRMIQNGATQPTAADAEGPVKLDENAVKKIVDGYIKDKDKKKKEEEDAAKKKVEDEGFKVGSDLKINTRWNPTLGLLFETPNKDFVSHLGGRFQWDNVWFTQSPVLKNPSQFGELQDGEFFRRVRIQFDGQAWEVLEWNLEYALEQTTQGISNLDEFWAGIKDIPIIGYVRAGHNKVPHGFEGDSVSSSKAMTFLERANASECFFFENFATGVWTGNHFLDDRMTYGAGIYRQDDNLHGNVGADFNDGPYGYSARVTLLPIWEQDGRCWLHLGASYTYLKAEKPDPGLSQPSQARFRSRPVLRDAIGDFGSGTLPGNSARLVDTGALNASGSDILGLEAVYVRGPFSLQAEYMFATIYDAQVGRQFADHTFNGGYLQASYILTGENRQYDRRYGREAPNYLAGPTTPFWLLRRDGGGWTSGIGAWEVAARYNYVNLNDGTVRGGVLNGWEVGVNWYLNPNFKFQIEYMTENRWNNDARASGTVQGIGTRVQIMF
jgi:phosphate-selective porin OprO/OprP